MWGALSRASSAVAGTQPSAVPSDAAGPVAAVGALL